MELHGDHHDGAFFGRENELKQLQKSFDRSGAGKGARVAVTGSAGTGKSRFLEELSRQFASQGATVAITSSDREAGRPYEIWRQVVRRLIELGHDVTSDFPRVYSDVLLQLVASSSSPAPSSSVLPPLPTEQTRYRLYDAVRMFLRKASKAKPLVILMADLQWADGPSARLLRFLFDFPGEKSLMFVVGVDVTDASGANPEVLALLERSISSDDRVVLGNLEKQWVVDQAKRVQINGDEVFGITKGHPLHTALVLSCLRDAAGDQAQQQGERVTTAAFSLATPQLAALRLIKRLRADAKRILAEIALVAGKFSGAEIPGLIQEKAATIQGTLTQALSLGLIRTQGGDLYQFRHPLIRQALIDILDIGDRMRILRDAAKATRLHQAGDRIWQAAQWYYSARDLKAEDGAATCLEAATASKKFFAPELASEYLRYAQELAPAANTELQERILMELALSGADAGNLKAANTAAEGVLEAMRKGGRSQLDRAATAARFAQVFHDAGAEDAVWRRFQALALDLDGGSDQLLQARLKLLEHGVMKKLSDAPIQAGRWLGLDQDAVRIAREKGNEDDYCRTLLVYEWMTVADIEHLLERAAKWKSAQNRARALSVAAETFMYRHGEFERACSLLEDQLHMHEASGSLVEQAKSLVRLTMAQLAAGTLEDALRTRTRAEEMVARLGPGYLIYEHAGTTRGGDLYPAISMESNFAWYVEGNWKAVADHWVKAISLEEPGGSPVHIVEAAMAAQAYARLDMFDDARRYLKELTPVLQKLEPRDWAFNGAVGRAIHAIWDMRDAAFAKDYRQFALGMLEAGVSDWTNTSLELTVARTAALLGNRAEADAFFDKAREKLHPRTDDPRRAIIDYDQAVAHRLLGDKDAEAEALLSGAAATFKTRGMEGWLRRAAIEKSERSAASR